MRAAATPSWWTGFLALLPPWMLCFAAGLYYMQGTAPRFPSKSSASTSVPRSVPPAPPPIVAEPPETVSPPPATAPSTSTAAVPAVAAPHPTATLTVRPLAPAKLAIVAFHDGFTADVSFRWESTITGDRSAAHGTLLFEIAPTRDFEEKRTQIRRLPVPEESSISLPLGTGRYFWRVRLEGEAAGEIRELWVRSETPMGAKLRFPTPMTPQRLAPPPIHFK